MTPIDPAVAAHLARFTGPQAATLMHLRDTLRALLPTAVECIKYGMPCFTVDGKAVAGYDGFKQHCSYFPHSGSALARVADIPTWATTDKGTLRFPIDRQLPKSLVKALVRARLDEIAEAARAN
ncbi:MAG: DUF1801 domain-containing protein [Actinomycetota bacterium]|nr:DUF1801 domain-containing protein [Actinomycetota bacterium]